MLKKHLLPLLVLFLAGCGQKGPLYLPQDPAAPAPPPTAAVPASAAPGDEAEKEGEEADESTVTVLEPTSEK